MQTQVSPERPQIEITPCPECGGDRVPAVTFTPDIMQVAAVDADGYRYGTTDVAALACTYCGHLTLYAVNPRGMRIQP
jgi:hypothetical protein